MKQVNPKYYLVAAALCLLCLLGVIYYFYAGDFSKEDSTQYVYIDDDDDLDSVRVKLEPIATSPALMAFSTLARAMNYADHIRTGRYAIPTDASVITVFRHLKHGHQEPVRLTIPESRTTDRLAGALSRKLMLDSAVVAILLQDSAFCAQQGYDTATIPCLFVPDTYEVYWNIPLESLMKRMKKEHDRFWDGNRTAKAEAIGLTPDEVCTMASIIDEETANNGEKPMIAGMYLNRLKMGMPLQADPTVKFALKNFAGEVGLSGEIRPVANTDRRIGEAARLGFKRIYVSSFTPLGEQLPKEIKIVKVADVPALVKALFKNA